MVLLLTNSQKQRNFANTSAVTSGLNDYHILILHCLCAHFRGSSCKRMIYRDYKMFDEAKFPHDLDQEMIKASFYQHEEASAVLSLVLEMRLIDMHF